MLQTLRGEARRIVGWIEILINGALAEVGVRGGFSRLFRVICIAFIRETGFKELPCSFFPLQLLTFLNYQSHSHANKPSENHAPLFISSLYNLAYSVKVSLICFSFPFFYKILSKSGEGALSWPTV